MAVWSEVALTETKHGRRMDSEFYKPGYIDIERKLLSRDNIPLKGISKKIDVGHVGSMIQHYRDEGITLLQTQQVDQFFLKLNNCIKITPEFHAKLKKSQVKKGDILIARSGSFGKASIYLEEEVINSADIIIIDINESIIKKGYLLSFLNSKFGSEQLIRFASGGVQGHVNLKILENLIIPVPNTEKQNNISEIIKKSYAKKKRSQELYAQAQMMLEHELGLDKLKFEKPIGYEANFSDVTLSLRSDAEYYNPTTYKIIKTIKSFEHVTLGSCFNIKNGYPWRSDMFLNDNSGEPVVRIRDIKPNNIETKELTSLLPSYVKSICFPKANTNDVVVGMDGLKYFYASIIENDCYVNQRVAHLQAKSSSQISPEYLAFIINSKIGQVQLLRDMTIATTVGHITNANIRNLTIPYPSDKLHNEITELVKMSIKLKKESKQFLEKAKQMVEDLIEEAAEDSLEVTN